MEIIIEKVCGLDVHKETVVACMMGIVIKMGLRPILDLDLRLGEGTGAALAMLMIEAGLKIYKEMATFGEAGVANKI